MSPSPGRLPAEAFDAPEAATEGSARSAPRGWRARLRAAWRRLLREGSSPFELGAAVFLGVLVSVTPFYGLQMLLVVALAALFRLNKVVALAAVQFSIPPVYPFLVIASLECGNLLLHGSWLGVRAEDLPETTAEAWRMLGELGGVWLVGSLVVGSFLGLLAGCLVFFLALRSPVEEALEAEREYRESQRLDPVGEDPTAG
ncbi:MAG: DUF2062 domain-containing protein [Planctomycetota bacterium]|nr:MAG: DUF2062 domain-containing protein [Planctomycetota bacterium]